jgi:hypothetical protein
MTQRRKTTEAHSYVVQYGITAPDKLLPTVFNCLQERSGAFGP